MPHVCICYQTQNTSCFHLHSSFCLFLPLSLPRPLSLLFSTSHSLTPSLLPSLLPSHLPFPYLLFPSLPPILPLPLSLPPSLPPSLPLLALSLPPSYPPPPSPSLPPSLLPPPQEAVEAYKKQNQFLSAELLEMNHLRNDDLAINKQLKKLVDSVCFQCLHIHTCICRLVVCVGGGGCYFM